jgi:hypothetical protein
MFQGEAEAIIRLAIDKLCVLGLQSASPPLVLFPAINKLTSDLLRHRQPPAAGTIEEWSHENVRGAQGRPHGEGSRAQAANAFLLVGVGRGLQPNTVVRGEDRSKGSARLAGATTVLPN